MIRNILALLILFSSLFSMAGCGSLSSVSTGMVRDSGKVPVSGKNRPVAELVELPSGEKRNWRLPENLLIEGTDAFSRIVRGPGLLAPDALEMASGAGSRMEYFIDLDGADDELNCRFQFLSTQGTGRLNILAIGKDGKTIASLGYVFTGSMPEKSGRKAWIDRRPSNNFQGGWVQEQIRPAEVFSAQGISFLPDSVLRYRVGIESGYGQHVLITELRPQWTQLEGTRILWKAVPGKAVQGETYTLFSDVTNVTDSVLQNLSVRIHEPYGYGLVNAGEAEQIIVRLEAGETVSLPWKIRAQRASAVNFGTPWDLRLSVNSKTGAAPAIIDVVDPAPGKVFYVMTEDLEPIDSAGYPTAWGNQNGWIDPEEFRVQLIDKAEALNRIAEKHGAFWTHYLAMPVMEAGEWAASQSAKQDWRMVLDQVQESVRTEAKRGHEYALHLHSDYDPEVSGNVLSYHRPTDGFWANHLRHGWAHSFPAEGDASQRSTRTGILFHHLKELTKLTAAFPLGEVLTSRTGSFDFGNGPESEAMSIRAYKAAGLWGNSDADGNAGGITSSDYRKSLYLTPPDDINAPASDLKKLGLVEFRPTPMQLIMYDVDSSAVLNDKVRQGVNEYMDAGKVRAGVHSIVGFSHAMFIMGSQGWKSTAGKHYQALDEHLGYLKREFVQKGLLRFGTATELVREYLDYYWPEPLVFTGPLVSETSAGMEFLLDFIGRHIPVDQNHRHNMSLKIPLRFRGSAQHATLFKNGQPVQELVLSETRYEMEFIWDNRQDVYRLLIGQRGSAKPAISGQTLLKRSPGPAGQAPLLPPQPDNLLIEGEKPRFQ